MRFRTLLVTGVEVLHLGGHHRESNAWPLEHWRADKGRFRLFTVAIDEQVSRALETKNYGGSVQGIVVALEVAAFEQWPAITFMKNNAPPSFKPKNKDLWCYAKLDWMQIQNLSLKQQFKAYADAVIESLNRMNAAKRKPKGFLVEDCATDLRRTLDGLKASTLTRSAYKATDS